MQWQWQWQGGQGWVVLGGCSGEGGRVYESLLVRRGAVAGPGGPGRAGWCWGGAVAVAGQGRVVLGECSGSGRAGQGRVVLGGCRREVGTP